MTPRGLTDSYCGQIYAAKQKDGVAGIEYKRPPASGEAEGTQDTKKGFV